MDLREMGYDNRDWINLAQDGDRWRAYVRAANEPPDSLKPICYLASELYKGDNAGEISPGSSTESYPAFARIELRENPGKNLNQVTCPDLDSNPGHLVLQPDALTVTPQNRSKGCLFHFCQAIWCRVVQPGLKAAYNNRENDRVRIDIRKLMSIPFIPLDHIVNIFYEVSDGVEESVLDLSLYIERTFVRGIPARGRRREVPPRFPPHVWNVYNLYLPNLTVRLSDLETDREPEDADSDLPAQNGEENPRTLPQRQDFQHQTQADDKHQRHGTPRGTPEMEMGRPRVETPRLQMGACFHHVGPMHREAKPRKTWDQMGGLLQEPSWTPVVQNSQEPRRMEIATVCQYREEEKELTGSLVEKKLSSEEFTGRNSERKKSSGEKKISDDRRYWDIWIVCGD
ncbi:hypothetical protein ANN_00994 [Periplaneta americana]|uniref:Uncharacterized protein n=1 Tax=Periplaneta americana TaxID=6978 RepID=A0ABQ8TSB7_PERAM|nr:hypothetical protein ANN_00994 [Periplaneta americana]